MIAVLVDEHTLVVDDPTGSGDPARFRYTARCAGVTPLCEQYEECGCGADPNTRMLLATDLAAGRTPTAHGRAHRLVDQVWMAATGVCYVAAHPALPTAAHNQFTHPGQYPIRWGSGDGTGIEVRPA